MRRPHTNGTVSKLESERELENEGELKSEKVLESERVLERRDGAAARGRLNGRVNLY